MPVGAGIWFFLGYSVTLNVGELGKRASVVSYLRVPNCFDSSFGVFCDVIVHFTNVFTKRTKFGRICGRFTNLKQNKSTTCQLEISTERGQMACHNYCMEFSIQRIQRNILKPL